MFLLLGGESISAGLARWIPDDWRELVVGSLNRTFRGYFAGQVLLALILSGLQVVVFTLLQIPYGILFALLIGFTTLIPYASALTITLVSIVLTVEDPRTGLEVLAAAISVGQVVDQVIAPRLVGTIVGLHPAWVLFSLPVGSRLGALLGCGQLLPAVAVPLASVLKTILDEAYLRLQPQNPLLLQQVDHSGHALLQVLAPVPRQVSFRRLVGAGNAGEFLDLLLGASLGIEALGSRSPHTASISWRSGSREITVGHQGARLVTVGAERRRRR